MSTNRLRHSYPAIFAIDSSSTHRDAPQSAAFVLDDLHCKALPVERILVDVVAPRRGARRAGWEGSKGKKGSLALDRLLAPCKLPLVRNMFYLRHEFTYIFEAPFCPLSSPTQPSTLYPVRPFVFVRGSTRSHERRKSRISRFRFFSLDEPYECPFPFHFPTIANIFTIILDL